ncbi:MAG: hypothetical protein ACD_46C00582G0001 [uncultured bacterium]|nr:MAG: hypothetical protein ACD_46C00582G0001 [uncultured bacterium]
MMWYLAHTSMIQFNLFSFLFLDVTSLCIVALLFIVMVAINAVRWQLLNNVQSINLGFSKIFISTYLGTAFNNLLPGSVGGDFVRAYYLFGKVPDRKSAIVLSILFDRITGLLGIFLTILLVGITHIGLFGNQHSLNLFFISCALICLFVVAALIISFVLPARIGISEWLESRYKGKVWVDSLLSFLEAIRIYRGAPKIIILCLGASILIQIMMVWIVILIAHMMHFPQISWMNYAIAIAVTQVANLVPITPGGIGVGEAAFSKTIILLNPHFYEPFATIFIAYRFIGAMVYLPGVLISMLNITFKNLLPVQR